MFGDQLKTKEECEDFDMEWIEEQHLLTDEKLMQGEELLNVIVQNIFRKAQVEKEYCIFYGDLCEKMIKLELDLKDLNKSVINMKKSAFRKALFDNSKMCFEKFFDVDEKAKSKESMERAILFKLKLYGNLEFVGELFRRKILPETVLISVFQGLLGMSEINDIIDDLGVEGAVQLMNKVGLEFETRTAGKDEKLKNFNNILNKFTELENLSHEDLITNRIKILIKNMFTNKKSGWLKTKDINEGGPKTKKEV